MSGYRTYSLLIPHNHTNTIIQARSWSEGNELQSYNLLRNSCQPTHGLIVTMTQYSPNYTTHFITDFFLVYSFFCSEYLLHMSVRVSLLIFTVNINCLNAKGKPSVAGRNLVCVCDCVLMCECVNGVGRATWTGDRLTLIPCVMSAQPVCFLHVWYKLWCGAPCAVHTWACVCDGARNGAPGSFSLDGALSLRHFTLY